MLFDFEAVGNKVGAFVSKAAARATFYSTPSGITSPTVSADAARAAAKGPEGIGVAASMSGVTAVGYRADGKSVARGVGGLFGELLAGVAGALGVDANTVKLGALGLGALLLLRK